MLSAIEAINVLRHESGALKKQEILREFKDNEDFRKLLYYALNPMLTYKVSERTLARQMQYDPAITLTLCDIYEVCETLSKRKALDDAAVCQVTAFLSMCSPAEQELYTKLLAKTLRLGVTAKTVNGELTLLDKGNLSDNEAFRKATGIINSEATHKTQICYTIFDVVPTQEFENGQSISSYRERRRVLDLMADILPASDHVFILPVMYSGTDQSKIGELLNRMVEEDKEGLIVNLDVPYKRKRHNGILKVKKFYTMDLPIIECEEGSGRLTGTLGAFVLDYKGNEVRVGSGFTDEQRESYWHRRDELAGVLCEVKYKEKSSDKSTGAESLQFPVFISLRTDKDGVSYG